MTFLLYPPLVLHHLWFPLPSFILTLSLLQMIPPLHWSQNLTWNQHQLFSTASSKLTRLSSDHAIFLKKNRPQNCRIYLAIIERSNVRTFNDNVQSKILPLSYQKWQQNASVNYQNSKKVSQTWMYICFCGGPTYKSEDVYTRPR